YQGFRLSVINNSLSAVRENAFLHGTTARDVGEPCFPAPAAADTRLAARCSRRVQVVISAATACRRLAAAISLAVFFLLASSCGGSSFEVSFRGVGFCLEAAV
ncbi:hypothetical protein E2562_000253, partial [Oryza meyeriana var. granulata]